MCVISQHQFAIKSADGRCSAEGSVCAFACVLTRTSMWKELALLRPSEFHVDRLPCNGTQLAVCTAAAVYMRFLDRVIHMRQFCDDPVARAMLARLAPHMVCTSDLSLLLRVLVRSRPELTGSEVCETDRELNARPERRSAIARPRCSCREKWTCLILCEKPRIPRDISAGESLRCVRMIIKT